MSILDKIIMAIFVKAGLHFFNVVELETTDDEQEVLAMIFRVEKDYKPNSEA